MSQLSQPSGGSLEWHIQEQPDLPTTDEERPVAFPLLQLGKE
jgi:hypothetical protein